jgi:uncharacterized protein YndB with AHSA1/START domain
MQTATAYVARTPDQCWRMFVDPALLTAWVPGLRHARVIALGADGLPSEIQFRYASSHVYSLAYTYDAPAREVRWAPRAGKRDAVSGSVRFDAFDEGTRVTYTLEHGDARSPSERAADDAQVLVQAFARWMAGARVG